MGLPPCHLLSRRRSTFVLCVALFSIFSVTTAVRLHSDVSHTDEVEGPTQLSNAHHTSSYQAQKVPKRLEFRLSRRSFNADKGGNPSQSSSNVAVNGELKLTAYFQEVLDRSESRRKWLAGNRHRGAHRNNNVTNGYTFPTYPHGGWHGEYLVDVFLGTPPQTLRLNLDTGSDLVWVNGEPNHFNAAVSSTFRVPSCAICCSFVSCWSGEYHWTKCEGNVCTYNHTYLSGENTSGVFTYDTVTLPQVGGGQSNLLHLFVGNSNTASGGIGADDVDGVMGLGMGTISFASQVAPQEGSVFSYCLVNLRAPPDVTGPLVFETDADDYSAYQFTPLVSNDEGHYSVLLESISVGGQQLSIPNGTFDIQNDGSGGFIFDSGSTVTYLYRAAYNSLVQAVQAAVSYPTASVNDPSGNIHFLCYDVADVSNPTFPEVSFTFHGGAIMTFVQENVFGSLTNAEHIMCLLLVARPLDSPAIFGIMQQQNRHIVLDVQGQRVGWSHPVDCSSM